MPCPISCNRLPRPSRKARAADRTVLVVDQAAFYLLPLLARTYAPRGQAPVLRAPLTRDRVSAIRAVTPEGRLFLDAQEAASGGTVVAAVRCRLLRHVRGTSLAIWDGAPIHHCQPVKEFRAAGAATRLYPECLPGYASELNADEGLWNLLKRREPKNRRCPLSAPSTYFSFWIATSFRRVIEHLPT